MVVQQKKDKKNDMRMRSLMLLNLNIITICHVLCKEVAEVFERSDAYNEVESLLFALATHLCSPSTALIACLFRKVLRSFSLVCLDSWFNSSFLCLLRACVLKQNKNTLSH